MTGDAVFCFAVDTLTKAASLMWQRDCGAIPVVDVENKILGIITDRDICIALATRNRKASEIRAGELCKGDVLTCSLEDDIKKAIKLMRKNQVRRLPVINEEGGLAGMITLADIVAAAGAKKKDKALSAKKVFKLFEAISKKPPIHLSEIIPEEAAASGS
jgi:CBS-domain-containing membrane protein